MKRKASLINILMAVLASAGIADAAPCNYYLSHKSLDADDLARMFEEALLYINDGDAKGTAFLIDRDLGLYLTAAHVVLEKADYSQSEIRENVMLRSRNPLLSQDPIATKVLALATPLDLDGRWPSSGDDLAILQLDGFSLPQDVRALELALRPPAFSPRDDVRFTGYSAVDPDHPIPRIIGNSTSKLQAAEGNVFSIDASVDGGDSGGPVFLDNGNVIGIVLRQQGDDQAVVHPVERYLQSILAATAAKEIALLDSLFSADILGSKQLALAKQLEPPEGISNLDLARAIKELERTKRFDELETELLGCPLYDAAVGRQIGILGSPVVYEYYLRTTAQLDSPAILRSAARLEAAGDPLAALSLYGIAEDRYRMQVAAILDETAAQRAIAGALARAANVPAELNSAGISDDFPGTLNALAEGLAVAPPSSAEIDVTMSNLAGYQTFTSDRLAVALNDYGRSIARGVALRAQLTGEEFSPDAALAEAGNLSMAIRATSIGAIVAGNPVYQDLNRDTQLFALETMLARGDGLVGLDADGLLNEVEALLQ